MRKQYVFLGASAASISALNKLSQLEPASRFICISQEKELPYNKCLLADLLSSNKDPERLFIYSQKPGIDIQLMLGMAAVSINPEKKIIELTDGTQIYYDALFLGMGSSPFVPALPGIDCPDVLTFHTLNDTQRILDRIKKKGIKKVSIIGAGLSGLECADALSGYDIQVNIIEKNERVLASLVDQAGAHFIQEAIKARKINLYLNQQIDRIEVNGKTISGLTLGCGTFIESQLVIFATGLQANSEIACKAGIEVGPYGIKVNEYLQTNNNTIFAGGDLIQVTDTLTGAPLRSCTWPDAMLQGMHAALAMAGQPKPYMGPHIVISSSFFGYKFAQAGILKADSPQELFVQKGLNFYHQFIISNRKLKGFMVYGDCHNLGLLRRLLITQEPVSAEQLQVL